MLGIGRPDAAVATGGFAAAVGLAAMSLALYRRRVDTARAVPSQASGRTDSTLAMRSSR